MKKIFLSIALVLAVMSAGAQNLSGTSLEERIGTDEAFIKDIKGCISLYGESYKNGAAAYNSGDMAGAVANFKEAYEPWKTVLEKAPLARVDTYKKGQFMLQTLIANESDATQKKMYFDELMSLYDIRLKNMEALNSFSGVKDQSSKGGIICRKAFDSYFMNPNPDVVTSYNLFKEGIKDTGNDTEGFVLYGFMQLSDARYKANNDKYREEYINDYLLVTDVCGRLLDEAKQYPATVIPADPESEDSTKWVEQVILAPEAEAIVKAYQPPFDQAEKLFVESGAADCDALEKIYTEKVEANKNDINYLNAVLAILTNFDCDKSNIYYTAADYAYQITKTPEAAIGKAQRLLKEGNDSEALKYFEEAIEMETDVAKKAKYAYVIAALYYKKGNTGACRQWCKTTLKYNPSNGGAYLLQASCIARGAAGKSPRDVATSYYYCLAADYCNKAKSVDPSSAAKASRQAAGYAAHYYPKSEAFFAGIKAGQTVSVMGETTVLRLR